MELLAFGMAAALLLGGGSGDPCKGETTPEMNACAAAELAAAQATLERYVAAARARLQDVAKRSDDLDQSGAEGLKGFDAAEAAWRAYRDAQCGAVHSHWSGGSIRTVMSLSCQTYETRLHTHAVWRHWLTYADSAPPILSEPPAPMGE